MPRRKNQIILVQSPYPPQAGAGFWTDANNFLKKNHIISRGLGAVGGMMPGQWGMAATAGGALAKQMGYGPPPRRRRAPARKKAPAKRKAPATRRKRR